MKNKIEAVAILLLFFVGLLGNGLVADCVVDPYLEVKPGSYITNKLDTFDVSVWLNDITADKRLVGIEFKLGFDSDLLEAQGATEGPFMAMFDQGSGTYFASFIDPSYVQVAILILPSLEEPYYTVFPEGSGEIAKIALEGIFLPPVDYVAHSCTLELYDISLIDDTTNDIPHADPVNGYYEIMTTLFCDINRDGQVDIFDISMAAWSFGAYPGHSRWLPYGPRADVIEDGRINIRDIAMIAKNFGQHI